MELGNLLTIIAEKLIPDRKEVREGKVKTELVVLLESVMACHNGYKQYKRDENDENYEHWQRQVRFLVETLNGLRTTLSTVWPEAFDAVHR